MPDFTGNNENYDEIVFNLLVDFDQMKKQLGDKADIEILLAKYPENIRDSLRNEVETLQQFAQERTPEKTKAMLPSLMAKIMALLENKYDSIKNANATYLHSRTSSKRQSQSCGYGAKFN